jgi:hypothetical protein
MTDRISGPLMKWFGSKWLSSKTLPKPLHDTIVEPFAGGAGYSLRHAEKQVILCESDPHLFTLWLWLIGKATEADIREIPLNVPEGTDIRTLGLSQGQQLLLKTWQRTNNVGSCWTTSKWGHLPGQFTANTRARVASEFHLIKHWKVQPDGMALLRELDQEATWFLDPPYEFNYQYRQPAISYQELGELSLAKKGQVIVCEAICPKTDRVPQYLPFKFFGERITSRRKAENHHHSKELIWENSNV